MNRRSFFTVVSFVFLVSCEPELAQPDTSREKSLPSETGVVVGSSRETDSFPAAVVLTNRSGVELSGELLGKEGTEIAFRRASDQREFLVSVETLSPETVREITSIPDGGINSVESLRSHIAKQKSVPAEKPRRRFVFEFDQEMSYEDALVISKEEGKNLCIVFLGYQDVEALKLSSDPEAGERLKAAKKEVADVKSFERTVLGSRTFLSFAGGEFIPVIIDLREKSSLPREEQRQLNRVAATYGIFQFPVVIVADSNENELLRVAGYDRRGPNLFVERLESALGR